MTPNDVMTLVVQFLINRGVPDEGDFHFVMKWAVPHGGIERQIDGVDFPALGFGIESGRSSWRWSGDKPSDEILTLLILALR